MTNIKEANLTEKNVKKLGVVQANARGFGFVTTEDEKRHFVPPTLMQTVVPGDLVSFVTGPGRKPGEEQVIDLHVVKREDSVWLGTLKEDRDSCILQPDDFCFIRIEVRDLYFSIDDVVVAVRIKGFDFTGGGHPIALCNRPQSSKVSATLEQILGPRTRAGFDEDYALAKYDFQRNFPSKALKNTCPLETDLLLGRIDCTSTPYVTVDGDSTKDFDDAVWAQKVLNGWNVSIAIADVSSYIPPGSFLDQIAQKRASSVYLPGKTIPMLPEELSNNQCALVPDEDRRAVVLDIHLNKTGEVEAHSFKRGLIRSRQRLTYTQAQDWRYGTLTVTPEISESLSALWEVFEVLSSQRKERGQLSFDDKDPSLIPDKTGLKLDWAIRATAHKVIEELMLLANKCAAEEIRQKSLFGIFRHQPPPTEESWSELSEWANEKGQSLSSAPSIKEMAGLIRELPPEDRLKASVRVRYGMEPACYNEKESGHYSLGLPAYTHFTSPIRRYADILVHRLILNEKPYSGEQLRGLTEHCSKRAKAAHRAERFVWDKVKKRQMFVSCGTNTLVDAYVVSMTSRGLKAVVQDWQTAVWVTGVELQVAGFFFDNKKSAWLKGESALEPGSMLTVTLCGIEEVAAKTEVQAKLA